MEDPEIEELGRGVRFAGASLLDGGPASCSWLPAGGLGEGFIALFQRDFGTPSRHRVSLLASSGVLPARLPPGANGWGVESH